MLKDVKFGHFDTFTVYILVLSIIKCYVKYTVNRRDDFQLDIGLKRQLQVHDFLKLRLFVDCCC